MHERQGTSYFAAVETFTTTQPHQQFKSLSQDQVMNNFITRADSINVINLRSLLGKKYKIEYDEAYYAEYGVNAKTEDPFLMVVPCQ